MLNKVPGKKHDMGVTKNFFCDIEILVHLGNAKYLFGKPLNTHRPS